MTTGRINQIGYVTNIYIYIYITSYNDYASDIKQILSLWK